MTRAASLIARIRAGAGPLALPATTAVVILTAVETAARLGWVAPYIVPAPSAVATQIARDWRMLLHHAHVTTIEIVLGFLLAVVVGIGLALAMVYLKSVERVVFPWLVTAQVVPKVAVGPLFIVWLGFGMTPKVIIAFLIAFFPILVDTMIGLKSTEQESLLLLRSMGARRFRTFWYLQLPVALPNIFAGMRVAITLATVGALVGEFVGANEGLGYLVLFANGIINTTLLFAALVLIVVISLLLYWAIAVLERIFIPWHVSRRSEASVAVTM